MTRSDAGIGPDRLVRVVVVDDHPVVREGTAAILAKQPGIEIAGTAGSLGEARALLAAADADVVLLDFRLGTDSGLNLLTTGADTDTAIAGGRPPARRPPPPIVVHTPDD